MVATMRSRGRTARRSVLVVPEIVCAGRESCNGTMEQKSNRNDKRHREAKFELRELTRYPHGIKMRVLPPVLNSMIHRPERFYGSDAFSSRRGASQPDWDLAAASRGIGRHAQKL